MTRPGRSPLNRSLERGIAVLRAFRPGTELLGNGDIAERTGLPRASISRLTQTLVEAGFLEHDSGERAYRLAAPVLTLGHAMRSGSSVLRVATPPMAALARRLRINVGLAVRDGDEMVYLESVRFNPKGGAAGGAGLKRTSPRRPTASRKKATASPPGSRRWSRWRRRSYCRGGRCTPSTSA
jgi:DNA-binding IclR family transcriptional regulator